MACSLGFSTSSPPGDTRGCPPAMVRVAGIQGDFCIHAYEVTVRGDLGPRDQGSTWPTLHAHPTSLTAAAGLMPTKGVTWYQAAAACKAMGWSLCTSQQWEDACDGQPGPGGRRFPTADGTLAATDCNIVHPNSRIHQASGSFPKCRTPAGVFDLEGNLWEWTDPQRQDPQGLPLIDKRGGGHYSGRTCPCDQAA
ncbi:MAG: SUMF1/EgtB/PvdO family nonheme iron enzyme, partial [Oligoflexia bacterium]|nr:SUMF1/EgtB/PvdO family nonheme iron enzyme [Oligoflexia bacterium]